MEPWWIIDDRWCLGQPYIVWHRGQTWCTVCDRPAPRDHIDSKRHKNAVEYAQHQQANAPAPALPAPASSSDAPAPTLPAAASSSADPSDAELHFEKGYGKGKQFGYEQATDAGSGYDAGHDDGYKAGKGRGYNDGYDAGREKGYDQGKEEGFLVGYQYGLHGKAQGKEARKDKGGANAGVTGNANGADAEKGQNPGARKHGDIRQRTWPDAQKGQNPGARKKAW
jgi:hypothetical protein